VAALDFRGLPDGIAGQYPGLVRAFGKDQAGKVMQNVIKLHYDGKNLPPKLASLNPRFLLEAIPEILDVKKAHYETFRAAFPDIQIWSVTSGFPMSQLGVGIGHPAFPHEINKIWEVVEPQTSPVTQLLWALGMIPIPVSDDWSFVLDVQFCGLMLTAPATTTPPTCPTGRSTSSSASTSGRIRSGPTTPSAPRERTSSPGPACTT